MRQLVQDIVPQSPGLTLGKLLNLNGGVHFAGLGQLGQQGRFLTGDRRQCLALGRNPQTVSLGDGVGRSALPA